MTTLIFPKDTFIITGRQDVGTRTNYISYNQNYVIIPDYDGQVDIIDFYSEEKFVFKDAVIPLGGIYDGHFFFIIDNYTKTVYKLRKDKVIDSIRLESKPTNIELFEGNIYITSTNPNRVYILDSNLNILNSINHSVVSPLIIKDEKKLYIPLIENYENSKFNSNILFLKPANNTYILNYKNIKHPIDIVMKDGIEYILNYYEGNIYKNLLSTQEFLIHINNYTTNMEVYKEKLLINSLNSGLYLYDIEKNRKEILLDVPIRDFAISPNKEYIYAISHIENKLYVIKDKKIYQELSVGKYPIDIEAPDNNVVLILSTEDRKLLIVRRFE
ncbi:MAG: YncE family protein [Thermotogota bacterium]